MTATDRLAALPNDARSAALAALDEISRPMTVREVDHALAGLFTRSQRRPLVRALLASLEVIALVPKQ